MNFGKINRLEILIWQFRMFFFLFFNLNYLYKYIVIDIFNLIKNEISILAQIYRKNTNILIETPLLGADISMKCDQHTYWQYWQD